MTYCTEPCHFVSVACSNVTSTNDDTQVGTELMICGSPQRPPPCSRSLGPIRFASYTACQMSAYREAEMTAVTFCRQVGAADARKIAPPK
jgi:hypothetical protein